MEYKFNEESINSLRQMIREEMKNITIEVTVSSDGGDIDAVIAEFGKVLEDTINKSS